RLDDRVSRQPLRHRETGLEQRCEDDRGVLVPASQHEALGDAGLRLGDERFCAEVGEHYEGAVEQTVRLLELAAARGDATEIRGRKGNADGVAGSAPDAQGLFEELACLRQLAAIGKHLCLVVRGAGDVDDVADASCGVAAATIPLDRLVPASVEIRLNA